MKKIVVVVDEGTKEFFEGKELRVINPQSVSSGELPVLVIMDGKEDIAVFKKWYYWKKVE